ncbi:MAG: Endo-1,4-beta-xylanase, partial [uncultured Friedmanniella sp.]
MSTTPDPTPVDPTPVDPTPVDPDLSAGWVDPTPVETPLAAGTVPGPGDVPLQDEPVSEQGHETPAREEMRRRAAKTAAAMRESDLKAIYAAAGATQVIAGAVRETVTETSRWASARLAELRFRRAELAKQAEEMRQRAEGLPEDVKAVPDVARTRAADLQQQATGTYSELADRGQRVLHDVRSDVVNRLDPALDGLAERLEAARRALRGAAVQTPDPPAP